MPAALLLSLLCPLVTGRDALRHHVALSPSPSGCAWMGPVSRGGNKLTVNKIKWALLGSVTEPGRYEYPFGYLTISGEDLAVAKQFPRASFTLIGSTETENEFRLGTFMLPDDSY